MKLHPEDSNIAIIELSQGKVTIIDTIDAAEVCKYNWYVKWSGTHWYAIRSKDDLYLHRFLMNPSESRIYVDHINGDTLNNCKSNLRLATSRQSAANRRVKFYSQSKYKGLAKLKNGLWQVMYREQHIGKYDKEEDAARAYDKAHLADAGEFARLNFPNN